MKMENYVETDRMYDLVNQNYPMLLVLNRFGISLGFGDKTIRQVCEENKVDTATFLAVVNLFIHKEKVDLKDNSISIDSLIQYLKNSHKYFLDYRLPTIRAKLLQAIESVNKDVSVTIIRFFDEYAADIRHHMEDEDRSVFPNIKKILANDKAETRNANILIRQHDHLENNISELKNIIIKYYPAESDDLSSVLFDIFLCEQDLSTHILIEDQLIVPLIKKENTAKKESAPRELSEQLSQREKEVVICVAKGMSNKQIADTLFLSTHTVITHRKNIAAKLQIHSPSGLTVYAIVNKLVNLEDIK